MPLRIKNGVMETVVREEYVGSASQKICYPGVSSCITITAVLPGGLIGAHITVSTETSLIDDMLLTMKTGGAASSQNFYVIGRFLMFKANTRSHDMNTRKKISEKIRSSLNKNARIWFYDSSAHADAHVFAERTMGAMNFYWLSSVGNMVSGFTYPAFAGKVAIGMNQFISK